MALKQTIRYDTEVSLLREGVAAAQAGDKLAARGLLLKALELAPGNEVGWLWLAYLAEERLQAIAYLRRARAINPRNEQTLASLKNALLHEGIALAKAGQQGTARNLLLESAELEPGNEVVWLWLASVAEAPADAAGCLRRALEINPRNQRAISWLNRIRVPAAAPRPVWQCPLCEASAPGPVERCPHCRAVLTLDDLDAALGNREVDRDLLRGALDRYQQANSEEDFHANFYLGVARLNLNHLAEALQHLQQAGRLRPADERLRAQVERLRQLHQAEQRRQRQTAEPEVLPWRERQAPAPDAAWPQEGQEAQPSLTVLVVDDSATVRKLVSVVLERRGHRVLAASGVMEALARLNDATPDLVLLDVTMPHTDGFQICQILKATSATKNVPVVMLSGKDGFSDKVRGRMAGAVSYITKPFEPATLIEVVEAHCGRARSE